MRSSFHRALGAILMVTASAAPAQGGRRPLDTESAALVADGAVELEAALTASDGGERDLLPGIDGHDVRLPVLGLRTGLGRWAELRVEGDLLRRFDPETGSSAEGAGDWRVATKVRVGPEGRRWAWAAWLGVKLPVASDNDGLGTNETDVDARALLSLAAGRATWDLNGGVAILGAPFRERAQIDLLTYGAAYRRGVGDGLELAAEIAGREGGDFFPARAAARAGLRWSRARWRLDGALGAGLTSASPSLELRLGVTFLLERGPRAGPHS